MRSFATIQTPSGANVPLAITVAVAAGPVRRFLIGDPQIQLIDVLAGATLDRLGAAEQLAGKGEVVASAEVIANLGDDVVVQTWRAGEAHAWQCAVVTGLRQAVAAEPWP